MIHNWGIKKFIRIVLAIQLAMLGLVGLSAIGFDIPVLKQIIGFIYLTFIPGLLILRILRLDGLDSIKALLYSVGLSIAFIMFTGLFMNMFYPLVGISKPISIIPVLVTITFVVLILCVIAYKQGDLDREALSQDSPLQWSELFSPPALLLFLLPVLSILGVFLVYFYQSNTILLLLLSLIALIPVLIAFDKWIPAKLYPLASLMISIALLWHYSLISFDLTGYDIFWEYIRQKAVLISSVWNPTVAHTVNAMLSIVMLAPIYSITLHLDTVWIFKIIYPIFFSLVPLALFQTYRKQTNDKIAFLTTFFFMSFPVFFSEMIQLARQEIAELFFALSILLFLEKGMNATKRATLLIIFGFSIVVSHYGLSYFYVLYLLMALPLLILWKSYAITELCERIIIIFSKFRHKVCTKRRLVKVKGKFLQKSTFSVTYVTLFIVFCVAWYMYVSSGSTLDVAIKHAYRIYTSLSTELFSPEARDQHILQALGMTPMRSGDVEWRIAKIFQYITQIFIIVGVLGLITNWRKTRFHHEYVAMSLVSVVLIVMCIVLPYFASALNMSRSYHITLFFLAPFCILGGEAVFRWLFRVFPSSTPRNLTTSTPLKLVVVLVLVPYFLFTTGFVFDITGATPTSMPLDLYEADWSFFSEPEIYARAWLGKMGEDGSRVYTDDRTPALLLKECERLSLYHSFNKMGNPEQQSYVFLRRWNIVHGTAVASLKQGMAPKYVNLTEIPFLNTPNRWNYIYDGGNAKIWHY